MQKIKLKKKGEDAAKEKEGKTNKDYEKERIIEGIKKKGGNYGINKSKERLKKHEKD